MRVGIAGPNGSGKTTLLRVLMGEQRPDFGQVRVGELTRFLYVDQTHEDVDPARSVIDFVSDGAHYWEIGERRIYVPGYLERLLFDMDSVRSPMRNLSGGERNRVILAKKLLRGGNVLVLDEPTNDLDLSTLRVLEEAILAFEGAAILVSHDRYFLNRLCTHLIVFEDGRTQPYFSAGNYDDYLRYREQREAADRARTAGEEQRAAPAKSQSASGNGAKPLNYKEKRELESIEDTIHAAEAEVARLESKISMPDFYTQPHETTRETLAGLDQAKANVAALYARWEELEARGSR
jgi:ATP-binding cassette subfamily F protein uup